MQMHASTHTDTKTKQSETRNPVHVPSKVGSVTLRRMKVGFLMYIVICCAKLSGYVADNAKICLLSGNAE